MKTYIVRIGKAVYSTVAGSWVAALEALVLSDGIDPSEVTSIIEA